MPIHHHLSQYLRVVETLQLGCRLHVRPDESRDEGNWRCWRRLLVAPWFRWKSSSPSFQAVRPHHLLHHPASQALLEPTELATVSPPLVHRAVLVRQADVLGVLLHGPLEEPLAALTGAHPIVLARRIVPTHGTQQR